MKPQLMGILNITPDSFYSQSRYFSHESAIERGLQIFSEGADILDIGGESTRPGSHPISEEEELRRVIPVIQGIKKICPIRISIDTTKPIVAKRALEEGASLINDIDGLENPHMREIALKNNCQVIAMHKKGVPKTMQIAPFYEKGIVYELISWFRHTLQTLTAFGIAPNNIILDPGIGFGKTVADNIEILQNLPRFKEFGHPILIGLSRKSFMAKILGLESPDLLAPTISLNTLALLKGADIIRVHDIKEHRSMIDILEAGFTLT